MSAGRRAARGMRIFLLLAALLLLCAPARAEESAARILGGLDLSGLEKWARGGDGPDVRALLAELIGGGSAWDGAAALTTLGALFRTALEDPLRRLPGLTAPALLLSALGHLRSGNRTALRTAELVGCLTLAFELAGLYADCAQIARSALSRLNDLGGALYPILAALLTALGRPTGASLFTPLAALGGTLISEGLVRYALGATGVLAALTLAGNLSGAVRLKGLTGLIKSGLGLLMTGGLALFSGLLAAQGALARGYDGATVDAAKMALGLLPVVGGEVADSLDALLASAGLVKNALGVAGLTLMCGALALPALRLGAALLAVRVAAALAEIPGDNQGIALLKDFSGALALLLAALVTGAVVMVTLVGASLSLFGGAA